MIKAAAAGSLLEMAGTESLFKMAFLWLEAYWKWLEWQELEAYWRWLELEICWGWL